ncbi:MAG TPA: malto-oligosyltrehalose synthase [Xanthobacteraceae bacterium]|nr:malto-oligosyltrehalose synthase [Xanthobacteraceae bacterium]
MASPVATYRVQLTSRFGFADAARIVPYLRDLGISHLYTSPILKARAGSSHGYDVVDPTQINPGLGGEEGFARLVTALRAAEIGLIVDFVPNHMGVQYADNPWWLDVLEWGPRSPHARAFDIEWYALPYRSRPAVLVPVLGRPYGEALAAGEIVLRYDPREGSFSAWYFEHRLPISPVDYGRILRTVVRDADPAGAIGRAILALVRERCREGHPALGEAAAFKSALAGIAGGADVINAGLALYRPGQTGGPRRLHRLLERQHYRLAHWRLASREINYRRFFDINTLAGLRVEDDEVFSALHTRVLPLIADGTISGLRLDHIDGLADPAGYCGRLQQAVAQVRPRPDHFPVLVEKILGEGERLLRFDGVDGTTGYEWLNVISRVLLDPAGLPSLDRTWRSVSGDARPFPQFVEEAKREVLRNLLASELRMVCGLLARIAAGCPRTRDMAADRLGAAFERYVVRLPIYRTYVTSAGASDTDRALIDRVIGEARAAAPAADGPVFDFLRDALTLDLVAPGRTGYSRRRLLTFVRKAQQLTGPVMAKALEDTAFYRYHRLLALNEVGGDPASGGLSLDAFHARMRERVAERDGGLTATETQDTKRGEDARARLLALSELPDEWAGALAQWQKENARFVRHVGARRVPSAAHEYMLYQALVGAWPAEGDGRDLVERFQAYALKAVREGKTETSWLDPDEDYEKGLADFITGMLGHRPFIDRFEPFARRIALLGALNSLTQVALKVGMPGIPDFYEGSEFWDLSLVDPDNRRPVDFAARQGALSIDAGEADWPALVTGWRDGRIKLALTRRLLAWRRSFAEVLGKGDYRPLRVTGPDGEHVIAFARVLNAKAAILVAGRLFGPRTEGGRHWPRAESWRGELLLGDALPGFSVTDPLRLDANTESLPLARLFDPVPVAALSAVRADTGAGRS